MVEIGSARIAENGSINGAKGDQKGGSEVATQKFYMSDKGWTALRAISQNDAKALSIAMIDACNNNHIGYGQADRDDVYNLLKGGKTLKTIDVDCNCDCSSLVRCCVLEGMKIDVGNFNTSSEVSALLKSGKFTQEAINSENDVRLGDILVTKVKGHTAICTQATETAVKPVKKINVQFSTEELQKGSMGKYVRIWQAIINVNVDGEFGTDTDKATREFQRTNGLVCDGIVGEKTWKAGLE